MRGKPSRRPHTSAGPRDKPVNFAGTAYAPHVAANVAVCSKPRRDSGSGASTGRQCWESAGTGSSNSRCVGSKRHSETSMRNIMNRPEYFESYASLKKNILGSKAVNGVPSGAGGSTAGLSWSLTKRISNNSSNLSSPTVKNTPSADSTRTTNSSVNSLGSSFRCDDSSQSSHHVREWEEELARIEARSKESSAWLAFVRQRKKSTFKSLPVQNA